MIVPCVGSDTRSCAASTAFPSCARARTACSCSVTPTFSRQNARLFMRAGLGTLDAPSVPKEFRRDEERRHHRSRTSHCVRACDPRLGGGRAKNTIWVPWTRATGDRDSGLLPALSAGWATNLSGDALVRRVLRTRHRLAVAFGRSSFFASLHEEIDNRDRHS